MNHYLVIYYKNGISSEAIVYTYDETEARKLVVVIEDCLDSDITSVEIYK